MAISFANREFLSRRNGDSAARKIAYNTRGRIIDPRTGEVFDYSRAGHEPALHSEISLPAGAPEALRDAQHFAAALEQAETRKNSQVGQDILYALPQRADFPELSDDQYKELLIDMSRKVVADHWTSHGLAAAWSIHWPDADDPNPHLHVLVSTRRLGPDGFDRHKARDLMPGVRAGKGGRVFVDRDGFSDAWGEWQQRYFNERGLAVRVKPKGLVRQRHLGPRRFRDPMLDPAAEAQGKTRDLMDDPAAVVRAMCANASSFVREDLEAQLAKVVPDDFVSGWADAILADKECLELFDPKTSRSTGRYVSRELRQIEQRAKDHTLALLKTRGHGLGEKARTAGRGSRSLRADQLEAFNSACSDAALVAIVGRAGVGKSYSAAAIRDAHLAAGYRVIGASLQNSVVQDLQRDGFDAMTLHTLAGDVEKGRLKLDRKTLIVVDEAGMADTRILDRVLGLARAAGCKVVLQGDPRQLASVGAGGLFKWIVENRGAAEIKVITRQKNELERQAAAELADGKVAAAIRRLDAGRRIEWSQTQEDSMRALVEEWKRSYDADPSKKRLVLAFTNRDGNRLNEMIREHLRARGELTGPDHEFELKTGRLKLAAGDLIQITTTDKRKGVVNGDTGVIQKIDGPIIYVLINGKLVALDTREFRDVRGGHCVTVHKSQGKTVVETYVFHSDHLRAAATYVSLSRQVERVKFYVSRDLNPSIGRLIAKVGRRDRADMSLAEGLTSDEVAKLKKQQTADAAKKVAPAAQPKPKAKPAVKGPTPRRTFVATVARELREIAVDLGLLPPRPAPKRRRGSGSGDAAKKPRAPAPAPRAPAPSQTNAPPGRPAPQRETSKSVRKAPAAPDASARVSASQAIENPCHLKTARDERVSQTRPAPLEEQLRAAMAKHRTRSAPPTLSPKAQPPMATIGPEVRNITDELDKRRAAVEPSPSRPRRPGF